MVTLMTTESNYITPPVPQTAFDGTLFTRKRRRVESEQQQHTDEPALKTINQATHAPEICMAAPDFNCAAVFNNQIHRLQLSSILSRHKAVVLFFYECDFTPSACKDLAHIKYVEK